MKWGLKLVGEEQARKDGSSRGCGTNKQTNQSKAGNSARKVQTVPECRLAERVSLLMKVAHNVLKIRSAQLDMLK